MRAEAPPSLAGSTTARELARKARGPTTTAWSAATSKASRIAARTRGPGAAGGFGRGASDRPTTEGRHGFDPGRGEIAPRAIGLFTSAATSGISGSGPGAASTGNAGARWASLRAGRGAPFSQERARRRFEARGRGRVFWSKLQRPYRLSRLRAALEHDIGQRRRFGGRGGRSLVLFGGQARAARVAELRGQRDRGAAGCANRLPGPRRRLNRGAALPTEEVSLPVVGLAVRAVEARRRGVLDHLGPRVLELELLAVEQTGGPDGHEVAVAQAPLADLVPVHHGAVRGVAVPQVVLAAAALDHGVPPRDHRVGQHEIVRGVPPDGEQRARELDLPPRR